MGLDNGIELRTHKEILVDDLAIWKFAILESAGAYVMKYLIS